MDLLELLKRPEGKTLEFKRDLSSPDGVLRSVVAFANTSGGTLLIGVEDRTGYVRGISDPLEMEERLANLISDSILPRLVPEIEILPWRNTNVLAVQIYPSSDRPHYLKSLGAEKGILVRVGSTNRRADQELIGELRRFVRSEAYDEQAMPELSSEALDVRVASELFAPVRKLKSKDFETLRLVTQHQGRLVPTIGGILLFGKEREKLFPDAWIQSGRFRGLDKAQIDDSQEIRSYPVQAVEESIAFVQKHAFHGVQIGTVRRQERWNLPPAAVREAIINAVVHTDYSQRGAPIRISIYDDRLEVENPGLLPFGLTVDDLQLGISKLRNRVIGRVFYELRLIEQWGSGVQRMISACQDAGLPAPTFEEIGTRFRVTISSRPSTGPRVDKTEVKILRTLAKGKGLSTQEIAQAVSLSARATRTRLLKLIARGLVREVGTGPNDPKRQYFKVN